jgi:hypothetical protein
MEVHFTSEQEAQLSRIASHAGTDIGRVVDCRREFVSASMGEFPDGRRAGGPVNVPTLNFAKSAKFRMGHPVFND